VQPSGVFRVGHMGFLNKTAYPWELLLQALNKLATHVGRDKVRFVHCGTLPAEVRDFVRTHGMDDWFVAEGMLRHKEAMGKIAATDAQVVLLYDTDDGKNLAPMKLYNYLIMNGPTLAVAPEDGAVARIIRQTRAGDVVSPKRGVDAVFEVLLRYYRDWEQGKQSVHPDEAGVRLYDREYHTEQVAKLLKPRQ